MKINVLDHGYVILRNISGPVRRESCPYDADDTDPANAARFSFDAADQATRMREDDLKLARYLWKNKHTTPFEMIEVWLEMQMPIFVARQFVRHRTVSINEVSARYTKLPEQFYIPDPSVIGIKSASNKQGRTIDGGENPAAGQFTRDLQEQCQKAYSTYEYALASGIPNEIARCVLPLNIYTKWLWNQDLHNLMHFLKLRLHPHAQYESRCYAQAIFELMSGVLPETMKMMGEE